MKRLAYALLGAGLLTACQPAGKFEISGTLTEGVESDTLLVQSYPVDDSRARQTDTIAMKDGKFAFNIGDSVLKQVHIFAMPSSRPAADGSIPAMSMHNISFLLLPGQHVTINGTMEDYNLGGGDFYAQYNKVAKEKCGEYYQKIDSISTLCIEMSQQGMARDSIQQVWAPVQELNEAIMDLKMDFIKQNPDKEVSVYLMSQLQIDKAAEMMDVVTDRVKEGVMAPLYDIIKDACDRFLAQKKAEEAVQTGCPAPEFTLKDINGKEFSLSTLKGKYVVLDFWGSWCGWCIKGIPEMKNYYAKYKGKVEFVGIDCNDTEEKWKAAVAEHKLPWINVRNEGEPDVTVMYAVDGFPTKYVIDPEGKIAHKVIGEDPAFYTYLDEVLGK